MFGNAGNTLSFDSHRCSFLGNGEGDTSGAFFRVNRKRVPQFTFTLGCSLLLFLHKFPHTGLLWLLDADVFVLPNRGTGLSAG